MRANQLYLRVNTGEFEGVYDLTTLKELWIVNDKILCKCCEKQLTPVLDLIQWGFWEDTYTTYFVCKACLKAYSYSYVVVCEVTEVKVNG